jgi:hypothetical protein
MRRNAVNPEIKTESTIAVELDLPRTLITRIDELTARNGSDRSAVVAELLRKELPAVTLAEVLAPVHEEFRKSGMTEDELNELLEGELEAHREGR